MAKKDLAKIGREMVLLGTYEDYDLSDIVEVLRAADDLYYNDQQSFIEDNEYDALRTYAEVLEPHHAYFTGVGSDVRGGKIKLPYQMGSLDQVQIGEIADWVGNWTLQQQYLTLTDKLDGTSAMAIYDANGNLQIAYSRGNGIEGADITRHIKNFVPASVDSALVVRGEVILTKANFDILRTKVMSRGGTPYKNARNMVAGLMNSSKNDPIVYDYLDFVAYDVLNYELSKSHMLDELRDAGFLTPYSQMWFGDSLTDDNLARYLTERRDRTKYEIDGLVIDVTAPDVRAKMNPTRDTLNPAYAIKYKVADASNQAVAKVVKVHWAASKHGYLKPRVEIEPVDLVGVTITYATGFNAKFIVDNGIGPGAEVQITRSGDVIPFIQKTVTSAAPDLPNMNYDWITNDDGDRVDIILHDHENNKDVQIKRIVDFFTSIDTPLLREGSVTKMYEAGYDTIEKIIAADEMDFIRIIGSNGQKIYDGLRKTLTDIPLFKILGAHSTVRGLGVRKFKKLQQAFGRDGLYNCNDAAAVADQEGFDDKTAPGVIRSIAAFQDFLHDVSNFVTVAADKDTSGGVLEGQKIVFTGFRDKALQAVVEDEGGTMQSGVSSKTTILVAANPNSSSGKMKKARDAGVRIMGIDEFKRML